MENGNFNSIRFYWVNEIKFNFYRKCNFFSLSTSISLHFHLNSVFFRLLIAAAGDTDTRHKTHSIPILNAGIRDASELSDAHFRPVSVAELSSTSKLYALQISSWAEHKVYEISFRFGASGEYQWTTTDGLEGEGNCNLIILLILHRSTLINEDENPAIIEPSWVSIFASPTNRDAL